MNSATVQAEDCPHTGGFNIHGSRNPMTSVKPPASAFAYPQGRKVSEKTGEKMGDKLTNSSTSRLRLPRWSIKPKTAPTIRPETTKPGVTPAVAASTGS